MSLCVILNDQLLSKNVVCVMFNLCDISKANKRIAGETLKGKEVYTSGISNA